MVRAENLQQCPRKGKAISLASVEGCNDPIHLLITIYIPSLQLIHFQTCMSKVALGTLFPFSDYINALIQEMIKALAWIGLVNLLVPFNKCFQFRKELLNRIKI